MSAPGRRFAQVDVFGEGAGYGNPVAVVIDGDGLDDAEMQRFANWTNLAETTFLLPPSQPGVDYRVRIFTPSRELPFAGHPTLGSAHAWLEAGDLAGRAQVVQECAVGLVELRRGAGGRLAFAGPPLVRSGPLGEETLALILSTLGLRRDEVVDHAWTDNGPGWATVLLDSAARVLALTPTPQSSLDLGVVGLHPDGTPELRAFVVEDGELGEDPVTGSLNAGVAQWLLDTGRVNVPYVARQGTALGRTGRIHVDRDQDGVVWVGGQTRTVTSGTASL
jgi:PhzF family phenazine biosynthesis protein